MTPDSRASEPALSFEMLALRARIFTVVFWVAVILIGIAILALAPSRTNLIFMFGGTSLAAAIWVLAYTALQQDAAAAWYRDTFNSDPLLALRTIDVGYLSEIITTQSMRRFATARLVTTRFPLFPGSASVDIVHRVAGLRDDPNAVGAFAGTDAAAHFEPIDHGGFSRRLERFSPSALTALGWVLAIVGVALAALGLVVTLTSDESGPSLIAAWLCFIVGVMLAASRGGLVLPARRASWARQMGGPSSARLLSEAGAPLRERILAALHRTPGVQSAVDIVQRSYPLATAWDAVALVRYARSTTEESR